MLRRSLLPLVAFALVTPLAAAGDVFDGVLIAGAVAGTPSTVPYQKSDQYVVSLSAGESVSVALDWTPTNANNDLDLILLLPSAAPVPVTDPVGVASSRVARATCADMAARSTAHTGTSESLSFTVPAGGEQGTYTVSVRGWVLVTDQPYTIDVTIKDANGNVRVDETEPSTTNQGFITQAPYCQM